MKNFSLRFACLFVILIFCLAPLGAVDLNQGNTTQNKDNGTDIIIMNDTDSGIEAVNDTVDGDSPKADVDLDVDDGDSPKADVDLDVDDDVEDIETNQLLDSRTPIYFAWVTSVYYGDRPEVIVRTDDELSGRISITCPDFENTYKIPIQDGYLCYELKEDLPPGEYQVKISYAGDSTFEPQEITDYFSISKRRPDLAVDVDNAVCGEKVNVNIRSSERFDGTVKVRVNNSDIVPVKVTGGKGSVSFDNLDFGEYKVEASFDGNDTFQSDNVQASFHVFRNQSPDLSAEVDDIEYGQHPVVKVHANKTSWSKLRITSVESGKTYEPHLVDGYCEFELDEDFDLGNHTLKVYYFGDNDFMPEEVETRFNVGKGNPNLSLDIDDCSLSEDNLHVVVHGDERFTGNVTLKINGRVYVRQVEVVDGYGEGYYQRDRFPGNYTAEASTEGNDHFYAGNCSTTYIVKDS